MSSVLLVVATGAAPYFTFTLPRLERLARELRADFFVLRTPTPGVPGTWLKMPALARFAPHYDRLTVCDADLFPIFERIAPADLEALKRGEAALALDQGSAVTTERFARWTGKHLGITRPTGEPYFNAGLMSFSRSCAQMIAGAFAEFGRTPDEFFHEQDFTNAILLERAVSVQVLPREMNWMNPQRIQNTPAKIVHLVGRHKTLARTYHTLFPFL